jgi:hypothetical protein
MRHSAVMLSLIALCTILAPAYAGAGPCSGEVAELRQAMPRGASTAGMPAASARQSVAAQLDRQPTPASVQRARQDAQTGVEQLLAQAEKFDRQGDSKACETALGHARMLLNP